MLSIILDLGLAALLIQSAVKRLMAEHAEPDATLHRSGNADRGIDATVNGDTVEPNSNGATA